MNSKDIKATTNRKVFSELVAAKGGKVLTEYVNFSTKVEIRCRWGHIWPVTPNHVVNCGTWCTKCPKNISIQSKENFIQIVKQKGGTLMSEYVNNNTHVVLRCHLGHEWPVTPHSVAGAMNSWCPVCSNNSPKEAEKNLIRVITEKGGTMIGTYVNAYTSVLVMCKNQHVWECIPHNVTSCGSWCSKCSNTCPEQAKYKFTSTVTNKGGVVLGQYINSYTPVRIKCNNGHEWDSIPGNINANDWCWRCAGTCPIDAKERLTKIVTERQGNMLDEYINGNTSVRFQCQYGHIWETNPTNILNSGTWCHSCNESHGERSVRLILQKHSIPFTPQKQHTSLPRNSYDFYFIYNNKEFYLEYDGEQHFRLVEFFCKTEEQYKDRRAADVLKTNTVINSNAYIIRLDHTLNDEQLETHILTAINGTNKLYLSNPHLYQWIQDGIDRRPLTLSIATTITQPNQTHPITNITIPVTQTNQSQRITAAPIIQANLILPNTNITINQPVIATTQRIPVTAITQSNLTLQNTNVTMPLTIATTPAIIQPLLILPQNMLINNKPLTLNVIK